MAIKYLNKEGLQHFWSGIKKANVASATKLQTARTINGTSFNGTSNITTANWGTGRSIGIVNSDGSGTAVSVTVNGSANVNLKLPATIKANLSGNASTATTATNATNASKAKVTETSPTAATGYNLVFTNATSTGNSDLRINNADAQLRILEGTTTAVGSEALVLGNAIAKGAAGNKAGEVRIYSENTGFDSIVSPNHTGNLTHTLPSSNGTLLNSANYTSYTVNKTGSGASGTWGISITGNSATATKANQLTTARTINGTSFNGTANITTTNWGTARNIGIVSSDGTSTAVPVSVNGSGNINLKLPSTIKASLTGNSSSATKLQTARKINGVAFDGTKDISIPIPEVPIGSIMPYAGYEAPSGWVFCEGQSLNSSNYPELYKVIGNGYGGTTGADFKVPDLRGRVPVGKEASGADGVMGRVGGEKVHQLTFDEMPIHKHPLTSWRNPGTVEPQPTSGFGFTNDDRGFANIATDGDGTAYTAHNFRGFGAAGGDRAHNNMQPYMILNYIIKAK